MYADAVLLLLGLAAALGSRLAHGRADNENKWLADWRKRFPIRNADDETKLDILANLATAWRIGGWLLFGFAIGILLTTGSKYLWG